MLGRMSDAPQDTPPRDPEEVRARIVAVLPGLPQRLRQCGDHLLAHPERIAVSTVAELARGAGVPPSALMRFCTVLGFTGFSEMQRLYRAAVADSWPDYAARLDRVQARADGPSGLLTDFAAAGHRALTLLAETTDPAVFDAAVAHLAAAGAVHIVGFRRSYPVAAYLHHALGNMGVPSVLHGAPGGLRSDSAMRAGDAVLAVTMAPYAADTVDVAARAAALGLPVVGITDGPESPVAGLPGVTLIVRETDVAAFRALTATLTLAAALAVAVGTARTAGDAATAR